MPRIKPPVPLPWERQPEETDQSWIAFVEYRDMPHTADRDSETRQHQKYPPALRSNREVSRRLSKNRALIDRWSTRHHWVARCAAYDADLDRERRGKLRAQALNAVTAHAQIATSLVGAISMPLRAILKPQILMDKDGNPLVNEDGRNLTRDRQLDLEGMRTGPLADLVRSMAAILPTAIDIQMNALGNPHEPLPEVPEWGREEETLEPVPLDRVRSLVEAAVEAGLIPNAAVSIPETHTGMPDDEDATEATEATGAL